MRSFPFHRVNWITSSFLILTALTALIGLPAYLYWFDTNGVQLSLFFFLLSASMLSITVGYHRLFSHLSFQAKWPIRLFTLIFGACAFENSCLDWASDHRRHHKFVDHDGDPYDISKGFFWAHIGWLMFKLNPIPPMDNVNDLRKDPLVMWQHRYVHWIGFFVGIATPSALCAYHSASLGQNPWIGALGGFLIPGIARIVVAQHCTFFINSLCHTVGKQPYSNSHSARDSAIMAFLTFGEGYHNFHHEFQHDYRNGVKPWQWDPSKWTIWLLAKIGLATNLRRVPPNKILLAELKQAKRLASQLQATTPCRTQLSELSLRLNELYASVEHTLSSRSEIPRQSLKTIRHEVRQLVRELRSYSRQSIKQPS